MEGINLSVKASQTLTGINNRHFSGVVKESKDQKLKVLMPRSTRKRVVQDLMDLTKFKLSLLNSMGAYSMFYFYAPISGVGVLNSLAFIFAT